MQRFLVFSIASLALASASLLSNPSPSLSQASPTPVTPALNCQKPKTTYEMSQCASQAFNLADRKLNRLYQQLLPQLNPLQKKRLTEAQSIWIKFRDASCSYEAGRYEGGTLSAPTYDYCRARITEQRVKDLESYFNQLQR